MKGNTHSIEFSDEFNPISFREERKRTGRYVAIAVAICIIMLGLHQALFPQTPHTPTIAGLFMFLYVFWVLFTASKAQRKRQLDAAAVAEEENQQEQEDEENNVDVVVEENGVRNAKIEEFLDHCECALAEVAVNSISNEKEPILQKLDVNILLKEDNILAEKFSKNKLNRTYSIA